MKTLIIFFNGWGFNKLSLNLKKEPNIDVLYINLFEYINFVKIEKQAVKYDEVIVIGYSFGVWYGNDFIKNTKIKIDNSIAICGNSFAISNKYGINKKLFDFTLETLNERNYLLFFKNIGFKIKNFKNIEKFEIAEMKLNKMKQKYINKEFCFKNMLVAKEDHIFKYKNMMNFHNENIDKNIKLKIKNTNHYIFEKYKLWKEIINEFQ